MEMADMKDASPRPWVVARHADVCGTPVACIHREGEQHLDWSEADTALIVRAVNAHGALVEALLSFPGFTDDAKAGDEWIEKKDAALRLARGDD
jgi:hypothetical protein